MLTRLVTAFLLGPVALETSLRSKFHVIPILKCTLFLCYYCYCFTFLKRWNCSLVIAQYNQERKGESICDRWSGLPRWQVVRSLPANARHVRDMGLITELGWCPKDTATHSNILDSRTPWTEESCHLRSTGSHKIVHNWSNLAQHTCPEFQVTISRVRVPFF